MHHLPLLSSWDAGRPFFLPTLLASLVGPLCLAPDKTSRFKICKMAPLRSGSRLSLPSPLPHSDMAMGHEDQDKELQIRH